MYKKASDPAPILQLSSNIASITAITSLLPLGFGGMASKKIIGRLPPRVSKLRFLSLGAAGWVYQITDEMALKYARDSKSDDWLREHAIYDILETSTPCPYVIQSFLRTPEANFLPYLSGGNLDGRLRRNQTREGNTVTAVLRREDRRLAERWTAELSAAVAWLESLNLAHGDLRPTNVLVDADDHLKLTDFGSAKPIGSVSYGSAPPWARLRPESGHGGFGTYGPETEQFAIGSMVYYITRGFEPYGDPEQSQGDVVDLLKRKVFPVLAENDVLDQLIGRCWMGLFPSVGALHQDTKKLAGAEEIGTATALSEDYCGLMREKSITLLKSGLLDWGPKEEA